MARVLPRDLDESDETKVVVVSRFDFEGLDEFLRGPFKVELARWIRSFCVVPDAHPRCGLPISLRTKLDIASLQKWAASIQNATLLPRKISLNSAQRQLRMRYIGRAPPRRAVNHALSGGPQQVDARESTFNNVSGDQHNNINIIINNSRGAYVEEVDEKVDEDHYIPDNPNIDTELNKYPPLIKYALPVVAKITTLVMNSVEAAASFIADVPEIIKSNIQSVTFKQTSLRYNFFSEPDPTPCDNPPVPVFPIYFSTFP